MSRLKRTFKEIRPSLKEIAPLTYYFIIGFAIFNLSLAISFPVILQKVEFLRRVAFIPIKLWVIIFVFYALIQLYFLMNNDWKNTKHSLLFGIAIKGGWLYQLISIAIQTGSRFVWFSCIIWAMLTYLKIFTYIYFTPLMGESREDD